MSQDNFISLASPVGADRLLIRRLFLETMEKNNFTACSISLVGHNGTIDLLNDDTSVSAILNLWENQKKASIYFKDTQWNVVRRQEIHELRIYSRFEFDYVDEPEEIDGAKIFYSNQLSVPFHKITITLSVNTTWDATPKDATAKTNYMQRLEKLAIKLHQALSCEQTLGYTENLDYGDFFDEILGKRNGDWAYIPSIYFAIINPANYGGEKNFFSELAEEYKRWPVIGTGEIATIKELRRLNNGHIFYRVNEIY